MAGESDKKGNIDDGVEIYMDLYKALQIGNWNAAKEFLDGHPHTISAKITALDKTALHVATEAGHVHIVEELVKEMSEENYLEIKDFDGFTPLARAAYNGNYRMAECMLGSFQRAFKIGSLSLFAHSARNSLAGKWHHGGFSCLRGNILQSFG